MILCLDMDQYVCDSFFVFSVVWLMTVKRTEAKIGRNPQWCLDHTSGSHCKLFHWFPEWDVPVIHFRVSTSRCSTVRCYSDFCCHVKYVKNSLHSPHEVNVKSIEDGLQYHEVYCGWFQWLLVMVACHTHCRSTPHIFSVLQRFPRIIRCISLISLWWHICNCSLDTCAFNASVSVVIKCSCRRHILGCVDCCQYIHIAISSHLLLLRYRPAKSLRLT